VFSSSTNQGHMEFKLGEGRVIPAKTIAPDLKPELGQQLEVRRSDGQTMLVTGTGVSDATVMLDSNHPLAGKALAFDIKLIEIV
jgi:peptidylprolyl isomerase